MGKRNNQLKMLANLARKRMMSGNYDEETIINYSNKKVSNYFIINARAMKKPKVKAEFVKIKQDDDESFISEVIGLLQSKKEIYNPLGMLADNEILKNLNDAEKQNYILRLSDKYTKIRSAYFSGDLKEAN